MGLFSKGAITVLLMLAWLAHGPAANAQSLPPHLASFAAQLLKANKAKLKKPTGDPKQQALLQRAYKTFRQTSMQYWSTRDYAQAGVVPEYSAALGLEKPNGKERAALVRLHRDWNRKSGAVALNEFYDTLGRDPPPDAKLKTLRGKLSEINKKARSQLSTSYTIDLDDDERIDLDWDPDTGDFQVTASKEGPPSEQPYEVTLKGKVTTTISDDGKALITRAEPDAKVPIKALDTDALVARARDLTGEWRDGEGQTWRIDARGGNVGSLTLARLRDNKKGDEAVYSNGRLARGKITASRIYTDIRDIKSSLPQQIRVQLVGNSSARERLSLTVVKDGAKGEVALKGNIWKLHVTYDPDNYSIESIHTPYAVGLTLTLADTSKQYRIGKIKIDNMPLRLRLSEVREAIGKLENEIGRQNALVKRYAGEFEKAKKTTAQLNRQIKAERKARARARQEIARLAMPAGLGDRHWEAYRYLQKNIGNAQLKREAGALTPAEEKLMNDDKSSLAYLDEKIAQARPAQYRDPAAYQARLRALNAQISRSDEQLFQLSKKVWKEEYKRKSASREGIEAADKSNILEETLQANRALEAKLGGSKKRIDKRGTLISWIGIDDENRKEIFYAELQKFPYREMLSTIDDEIDDARDRVRKAKIILKKATDLFTGETQKARELGEIVAATIMSSARGKQGLAVAAIAFDVIKDFVKGGIVQAVGGAAYKLAIETPIMNLQAGRGAYERSQVKTADEREIEEIVKAQFRQTMNKEYDTNSPSHWVVTDSKGILTKRGKKTALSALTKDTAKSIALRNGAGRWAQEKAITERLEDLDRFLKQNNRNGWLQRKLLKRRQTRLDNLMKDFDKLRKPNPVTQRRLRQVFSKDAIKKSIEKFNWGKSMRSSGKALAKAGGSMAEGLVKDYVVAAVTKSLEASERGAWYNFYVQDLIARGTFGGWKIANMHYFEVRDELKSLLLARKRFVTEVEPETNFRVTQNNPFPDDARLVITLNSFTDDGNRTDALDAANATLSLAGIAAIAQGKAYKFDVSKVGAADGAALPLVIVMKR